MDAEHDPNAIIQAAEQVRPFRFEFALSKLRVRFNKESRYRRLITAEMDKTHLCYSTKEKGGIRADASIGNFSLLDPAAARGDTLYGRILGLKTDLPDTSSLWKIKYETFPRQKGSSEERVTASSDSEMTSAVVDSEKGFVYGCDTSVELVFSPMRFVYLQQLWLEITDYFFEGIVGYEVWGKLRPDKDMEQINRVRTQKTVEGQQTNSAGSHLREHPNDSDGNDFILGSDAAGLSFLRFEIKMDSPIIILPVSYRSPHHMRISLGNMACTNWFCGHVEVEEEENDKDTGNEGLRMQWYNNCRVSFKDFSLTDWEETSLTTSDDRTVGMQIHVKWPIGPTAPKVIPKWNVKWSIDPIHFRLRRADYALFQHFIYYNVGEESRHLDEWNALQGLSSEELHAYKESIAVHFGYDKKDGPHTAYFIQIECDRFIIDLAASDGTKTNSNGGDVGQISCANLNWSMKKLTDRITKQRLTCGCITLEQSSGIPEYSGFRKLLLPLQEAHSEGMGETNDTDHHPDQQSELVYESTSRPNGDNVKSLWIYDACIYFIYGAFMHVKDFFSNLPDPEVWTRDDISSSMQIGDRWYRIGGGGGGKQADFSRHQPSPEHRPSAGSDCQPLYQFRLVLVSPRIVLVSDPSLASCQAVTLKLSHLDYFYENHQATKTLSRCFFVDGMELFTGLASAPTNVSNLTSENSLIHPLCVSFTTERVESTGTTQSDTKIATDVVRARAAYTDLDLAADVFLALTQDLHGSGKKTDVVDETNNVMSKDGDPEKTKAQSTSAHQKSDSGITQTSFSVVCAGFDLLVIDDSKRHFANAQKLMELSLGEMKFLRRPRHDVTMNQMADHFGSDTGFLVESAFGLKDLVLKDHLQPKRSRFRCVASSSTRAEDEDQLKESDGTANTMQWESHAMIDDPTWGFQISPDVLRQCNFDLSGNEPHWLSIRQMMSEDQLKVNYKVEMGAFNVQWNPSTVIAMQRFLGRFKKASKMKVASISNMVLQKPAQKDSSHNEQTARLGIDLRVQLNIESISLCLNKENQDRRLVKTSISLIRITLRRDSRKSSDIQGIIGDVSAWDSDIVAPIHESNRQILATPTATNDFFLSFHYRSFKEQQSHQTLLGLRSELPKWVHSSIVSGAADGGDDIDYFLSVEFASLKMIHLRERTEEILDYLSNGLPGKGMGVTSAVAKGFIKERMKTRSFLQVHVASPHLFSPRHRLSEEGLAIQLGDVDVKSWFEERNSEDVESLGCDEIMSSTMPNGDNSRSNDMDWYRVLSLHVSGLGWEAIRTQSRQVEKSLHDPINLRLSLFKPSWYSNSIVVRGNLTHIEYALRYTDFTLLNEVVKYNLGKSVDRSSWDNVEKAYWQEEGTEEQIENMQRGDDHDDDDDAPSIVRYAPDARIIRYGAKAKGFKRNVEAIDATRNESGSDHLHGRGDDDIASKYEDAQSTLLDIKFSLNGIVGKIIRDDHLARMDDFSAEPPNEYEIIRLIVKGVDFSVVSYSGGKKTLHLSLHRIDLYDMGDVERLALEEFYRVNPSLEMGNYKLRLKERRGRVRKPSAFSVLAEGYQPPINEQNSARSVSPSGQSDPQVILSIETRPSSDAAAFKEADDASIDRDGSNLNTTTVARVVINYLSLCALMPPLVETAEFFSASWSTTCNGTKKSFDEVQDIRPDMSALDMDPDSSASRDESKQARSGSGGGIHIKLVAQYPRMFLLADESDPHTRALVLRGLAVVNASKEDEADDLSRILSVTSIDANFHHMESYINPNVDSALGPNRHSTAKNSDDVSSQNIKGEGKCQELGIALIEPVTASFDFCRIDQVLHPTSRTVYLTMEPVSTTLSFEDIGLLDVVLKRWSSERKQRRGSMEIIEDVVVESAPPEEKLSRADMVERSREKVAMGPVEHRDIMNQNHPWGDHESTKFKQKKENIEYDVVFEYKKLGIGLRRSGDGGAVVESVQARELLASIEPGDILLSVDSKPLSGLSFGSIVELISLSPRPMTIHFQREIVRVVAIPCSPTTTVSVEDSSEKVSGAKAKELSIGVHQGPDTSSHYDNKSMMDLHPNFTAATANTRRGDSSLRFTALPFTTSFSGKCTTGIQLDKSVCGNLAVVSHIDPVQYFESLDSAMFSLKRRVPRPGAIILAHDGKPSTDMGCEAVEEMLSKKSGGEETFSLTFLEAESECWPVYDRFDVQIAGLRLTLIDDINGRDMPVLRANIKRFCAHIERGFGLETSAVALEPPLLLTLPSVESADAPDCQVSDLSESVNRVHVQAELGLEYYNARIASWEPFLEPQLLRILYERQNGNTELAQPRPGSIAFEISDGSLVVAGLPQSMQSTKDIAPSIASINLTDSAAEKLFRAYFEWRQWRMEKKGGLSDRSVPSTITDDTKEIGAESLGAVATPVSLKSTPGTSSPTKAAQEAALAALNFAQRRGASTQQKGDSAKPFLLRNQTGMRIAFVQQDNAKSVSKRRLSRKEQKQPSSTASAGDESFLNTFDSYQRGSERFDASMALIVEDKEEARFSMDVLAEEEENDQSASARNVQKSMKRLRREYDGRFPRLAVSLDGSPHNVALDLVNDLPVVKIGKSLRRLRVRRKSIKAENTAQYILVLWNVELENNRRILTISSAVSIASIGCGIPFEVGIKHYASTFHNADERCGNDTGGNNAIVEENGANSSINASFDSVQTIGIACPGSPCFLPLWLDLQFEVASVFVRPASQDMNSSDTHL